MKFKNVKFNNYEQAIEYLLKKCKTCSDNKSFCYQDKKSFENLEFDIIKSKLNQIGYNICNPNEDPILHWASHILDDKYLIYNINTYGQQ